MDNSELITLGLLREITGKVAPGRFPAFTEAHVLIGLEKISSIFNIGRFQLSKEIRLGEGTTRTLVNRMKKVGLIDTDKRGMHLTEKGNELLNEIGEQIQGSILPELPITVGPKNFAVRIKGGAYKIKSGVEQRDDAIIAGALGATTLIVDKNNLKMPSMKDEPIEKSIHNIIINELNPSSGDAIIIGSSVNFFLAEIAAKAAALKLLFSS